jgi:hypothetical protein
MGFEVVTTFRYTGQPSNSRNILRIWLSDKTCLVATDGWMDHSEMDLVLHKQHLPPRVVEARKALVRRLRAAGLEPPFSPAAFRYSLPRDVKVGDRSVPVVVHYGNRNLTVTFQGPVVKLEAA